MKRKFKILLSIFSAISCCFLSSLSNGINAYKTNGSDFINGQNYNFVENFKTCLEDSRDKNFVFSIDSGRMTINQQTFCSRLYENEIPFFEIRFCRLESNEFDAYWKHLYAKHEQKNIPTSRSFSYILFGADKFVSYIYSPQNYLNYEDYDKKITGVYTNIEDSYSFDSIYDADVNALRNNLNNFLDICCEPLKSENAINFLKNDLFFSLLTLVFFTACILFTNRALKFKDSFLFFYLLPIPAVSSFVVLINKALDMQILIFLAFVICFLIHFLLNILKANYVESN